jgi:hypothetical protein
MTKNTAVDLIDALARNEAGLSGQKVFAPLLGDGRVRVRLRGLIHELLVRNAQPGWWVCRLCDARRAEVEGEALPWQRGDYLALWPVLRLVLLEPVNRATWLALAYNPSDAVQRFGIAGPLLVHLVEGGQPFERIVGRIEGRTIWYDDLDRRADPSVAEELRAAFATEQPEPGVAGLGAGERTAYALLHAQRADTRAATGAARIERRLRHALEIGGAQLLGYQVTDFGLRVTWERAGQRSVTLATPELEVVSAGICLSGEDHHFDLQSIIGVVQEAPQYARWNDD